MLRAGSAAAAALRAPSRSTSANQAIGACRCQELGRGWSGSLSVFMDEPVASARCRDRVASTERCRWRLRRRLLAEGAMRAVLVVMLDVLHDEPAELLLVPDDGPVEQFAAQAADPLFVMRISA